MRIAVQEIKRVLLNRRWLAIGLLMLVLNLVLYGKTQADVLGVSLPSYAIYTNEWAQEISNDTPLVALAKTQSAIAECNSWQLAGFLVENKANDATIEYYRNNYPDIDAQILAVQNGNGQQIDRANIIALERWQARLCYHTGYSNEISRIVEQAKTIQSNPRLAPPASFTYRNAVKTSADYASIQTVSLTLQANDVVSSVITNPVPLLLNICMMFITVVFLQEPQRLGVEALIYTTVKGRTWLACSRIGIVVLSAAVVVVTMLGTQLLAGMLLFQQGVDLTAPVQSVELLQNWTSCTNIGVFLLWFGFMQILGLSMVGLFLWIFLSRFRSLSFGLALCVLVLLIEYRWFNTYAINDAGYFLASCNIFHLLSVQVLAQRYFNYDLFGWPVGEKSAMLICIIGFSVILATIIIIFKPYRDYSQRKALRLNIVFKHIPKPNSAVFYELKNLLLHWGGVLFLVAGLLLLFKNEPDPLRLNQRDSLYVQFVHRYEGYLTQQTLLEIKEAAADARAEYTLQLQEIALPEAITYYEARSWALDKLEDRYTGLLQLEQSGVDGLRLMDEQSFKRVYGDEGLDFRSRSVIIVLATVCFISPLFFSIESTNNMIPVLLSTVGGRKELWTRKLILNVLLSLVLWLLWTCWDLQMYGKISGGLETLKSNCLSLSFWSDSKSCPILQQLIGMYSMRLLLLVGFNLVVFCIAAYNPVYLNTLGIGLAIALVPFAIEKMGVDWMGSISLVRIFAREHIPCSELDVIVAVGCGACSVLAAWLSSRFWKRYSVAFD